MKGGAHHSPRRRHLSFILVSLVLTTVLLWTWEKNPLATTLQLVQKQYQLSYSDLLGETTVRPNKSTNLVVSVDEANSHSSVSNKTQTETLTAASAPLVSASLKQGYFHEVQNRGILTPSTTTACNYAKGRWIADSKRPLYSGIGCKQWLSPMWACRLTHRTDFSFEGYRWQPDNCRMPQFERFEFLRKMQDKTIAFIGDSLGRQQFQSLMCMVTGGEYSPEVENVGWVYGLVKARGAIRPDGWAYRFPQTNTTILYYWSATLSDLVPLNKSDPLTNVALHLDRPPAFLRQFIHRFDVLILNTGHHWNRGKFNGNRWAIHADGKPNEDNVLNDMVSAKNFTIYSIVRWLDSQIPSYPRLKIFFRTISPRHFLNGDWNTGGSCDNTTPLSRGSEVAVVGSSDASVENALKGTKTKILDVTAISQLRDEGHISRYSPRGTLNTSDCLHWCLPGIPDTWNELLIAQI